MATAFEMNYEWLFEIDTTPLSTATYARLGKGIESFTQENNEEIDQTPYLDLDGGKKSTVTGFQKVLTFEGSRVVGDAAQDYIVGLELDVGEERETHARMTDPEGNVVTGNCDLCNIKPGDGGAAEKSAFSVEVHFEGKPTKTVKAAATALTATVATGTVVGATKFTATPGSGNSLRYKLQAASAGTVYGRAYFNAGEPYTSGGDIMATVGQYLCMYEVDAMKHIVKYAEEHLEAADINPGS